MSGRRIVLTSGKGGVGKTTVAANLGLALSGCGERVAFVDADIGLNNLDVALNLEGSVVYDIADVAEGRARLRQALIPCGADGLSALLPSAKNYSSDKLTARVFSDMIGELAESFSYVLIDCPAGIDGGFHRAVSAAEEAIVVTTPHVSAVRDADRVVNLLSTYRMKKISLAVNRIRRDLVSKGDMLGADSVAGVLRLPLCAAIPESDSVTVYTLIAGEKRDPAAAAYAKFARYVREGGGEVLDLKSGGGFIKKLFGGK